MVVLISNGDDASEAHFSNEPVTEFLDRLLQEESSYGVPATVSAVVGDAPDGCTTTGGWVPPGLRFLEVQAATQGAFVSICGGNMTTLWDNLVVGGEWFTSSFTLAHRPVMEESMVVRVNDVPVESGWQVLLNPPRLTFDDPPEPNARIVIDYALENIP